jgi:hypothetical protein
MRTTVNKIIITWKLGKELVIAGIVHNGMSLFGNELEILLTNENQVAQAQVVIDAHDGIDPIAQRLSAAKLTADNIPNWATWTQAQLQTWWDNNLADSIVDGFSVPANVKVMLKAQNGAILRIAQLEIALRDQIWPDLPE